MTSEFTLFRCRLLPVLLLLFHCVQNPVEVAWDEVDESVNYNHYSDLDYIAQRSSGQFFGMLWSRPYFVILDSAAITANRAIVDTAAVINARGKGVWHDAYDNILVPTYNRLYVLTTDDSLRTIEFNNQENIFDDFPGPVFSDSSVYFATKNQFWDELIVRKWDGTSLFRVATVDDNVGDIVGIIPGSNTIDVFTSDDYDDGGTSRHYRFIDGNEVAMKQVGSDSMVLLSVVKIDNRFIAYGKYNFSSMNKYFLGWITDGDSLEMLTLLSLSSGFDYQLQTENAWYLHKSWEYEGAIYKITGEGIYLLDGSYSSPLSGILFPDKDNRPTFFYTATRRFVALDTLDGYESVLEW